MRPGANTGGRYTVNIWTETLFAGNRINIRVDEDLGDHFWNLLHREGKSPHAVVGGLVQCYAQNRDRDARREGFGRPKDEEAKHSEAVQALDEQSRGEPAEHRP